MGSILTAGSSREVFHTGKLNRFDSVEILFPEYFQSILEYFHTTDNISILQNWTKYGKLAFPTFFYNISKICPHYGFYGIGSVFPVSSGEATFTAFLFQTSLLSTHIPPCDPTSAEITYHLQINYISFIYYLFIYLCELQILKEMERNCSECQIQAILSCTIQPSQILIRGTT